MLEYNWNFHLLILLQNIAFMLHLDYLEFQFFEFTISKNKKGLGDIKEMLSVYPPLVKSFKNKSQFVYNLKGIS